ncbi:MAG: DUF4013 domain-containing protein [Methanobacterium sp.]|nr:DUF4013 domain-containing protein [Methanobacterium sp.]
MYPLSDLKKFLILGIITLITSISAIVQSFGAIDDLVVWILLLIGFVIGFLVNGYFLKILNSSLGDLSETPVFGDWKTMFTDGLKVFLVSVVYSLPAILIIIYFIPGSFEYLSLMGMDLNYLLTGLFESKIGLMFLHFIFILNDFMIMIPEGVTAFIGILYMVAVAPVFFMALVHMTNYDGDLKAAFRFNEIINEISEIGWGKLIIWYVTMGIIFLVLSTGINILAYILYPVSWLWVNVIVVLYSFFIAYLIMFFARSSALLYISE